MAGVRVVVDVRAEGGASSGIARRDDSSRRRVCPLQDTGVAQCARRADNERSIPLCTDVQAHSRESTGQAQDGGDDRRRTRSGIG